MRRAFLLLALAACAGPPLAEPVPDAGKSLVRVVTWNVHNLFDEIDRTTAPGNEDDLPTAAEVAAKLAQLDRVLARIDADVIFLQEVENLALLERLAAGLPATHGYRAFLREGYDPRGIDVGVLSRLPFQPGPSHLDDRSPDGRRLWSRDVLEIHVGVSARPLVILGAHLISRIDPGEDDRRRLQATRLRQMADELRSSGEAAIVMIVGDLNDLASSAALEPLLGDHELEDLGRTLSDGWTWSGGGARERIDYALVPTGQAAVVTHVEVEEGPDVTAASDHRPLVVDLWCRP